jgi:hypothetical protein
MQFTLQNAVAQEGTGLRYPFAKVLHSKQL